jgi:CHAD domain-containing protein
VSKFAPSVPADYAGSMSAKWAEIADPQMPAREFARTVLGERMEVVESLLPRAAHHYKEDIEHVHQLRVACRRASAALRAFAPLMNKKPKQLKKWLSEIRDAAGSARDVDVLLHRFEEEQVGQVTEYATARLKKERLAAQKPLVKIARRASGGQLDEAISAALELFTSKRTKKTRLDRFGREAVRQAYLPFAKLAALENPTIAELHQLRIAGKRLRYSLEIFHTLCPELHDEVYPLIEELQSRLGEMNDHATAQSLYQSWLAELPAEALAADLAGRVIHEFKLLTRAKSQFIRWWNPKRIAKIDEFFTRICG